MATDDTILTDHSLVFRPDGLGIEVTLPWYRSLWLSSVSQVSVAIDGVPVPEATMHAELAGNVYSIADLGEQWDVLWFIQDRLILVVPMDPAPAPGDTLDVTVSVVLRMPYMQIAPQTYVTNNATNHRTLTVQTGKS